MADRYTSDRAVANRALIEQIKFVYANLRHLRRVDRTGYLTTQAIRLHDQLTKGYGCSNSERKLVDEMYEKVFKGANFDHVEVHEDRKKKSLRYGHQ